LRNLEFWQKACVFYKISDVPGPGAKVENVQRKGHAKVNLACSEERGADIPVQMDLARDMKVKPVSNARFIHKTCPMFSDCMNTDTTNISHQSVCQKKAELSAIYRSPEDGRPQAWRRWRG
jgi:hypothetical protein